NIRGHLNRHNGFLFGIAHISPRHPWSCKNPVAYRIYKNQHDGIAHIGQKTAENNGRAGHCSDRGLYELERELFPLSTWFRFLPRWLRACDLRETLTPRTVLVADKCPSMI